MARISFTPAQEKVIKTRNKNLLVSAAAGSGKTAVLTERIVDRICEVQTGEDGRPYFPVSIDRLLVVTFTEAAACEMRERIVSAIGERQKESTSDAERAHLLKQQTLAHSALIMTVHGFCLYLIRNHFDRIGIDPAFRVSSEEENKLLLEDALDAVLSELIRDSYEEYELLEDRFSQGFLDDRLKNVLRKLHFAALSQPFPTDWYEDMLSRLSAFEEAPEAAEVYQKAIEFEDGLLSDCLRSFKEAIRIAELPEGPAKYLPSFRADEAFIERLLSAKSIRERNTLFETYEPVNLGREKDSDLKEQAKRLRDEAREVLKERIREKFHENDMDTAVSDDRKTAAVLKALLKVSEKLYHRFNEEKRKKNVIDFSDMEHFALEILLEKRDGERRPTSVAESYRKYFEEVMVDEYQDSNYIQEKLLWAVSKENGEGNRFMVGDVKQSIYRFRLARPEIFREKFDTYTTADAGHDQRIDLSRNFRSRQEVLGSVNRIFTDAMHRSVGNVEYDASARLNLGAAYYGGPKPDCISELIVLNEEDWKTFPESRKVFWEALAAGRRIQELMEEEYMVLDKATEDGPVLRKVRYSDIVLLVRKARNRAPLIKSVLEQINIPAMVISKEGFFLAPEIILVLNMIAVISNPRQDIALLGVLHSFIGGFREEEIAELRGRHKEELLYDSMMRYALVGSDEAIKAKILSFTEKLEAYRERAERESVYGLLLFLFEEEGVMDYYRSMNLGEQRAANLKILLQKAKEFASTGFVGLAEFVRYIENVKSKEIDFGEANIVDENANVVRIYTMHKSKGLEFPVCFLMGCGDRLSSSSDSGEISINDSLGIAADYADPVLRIKRRSFAKTVMQSLDQVDKRGEDLRLLYVAMTRAREKLIMVGCASRKQIDVAKSERVNRDFTMSEILGAGSFLHFLLPEAYRNPELFDLRFCVPEGTEEQKTMEIINREQRREELMRIAPSEMFASYRYPMESLEGVFTKTTVSDLKKAAYLEEEEAADELFKDAEGYAEDKEEAYIPAFMRSEEKTTSGSLYGTAHHRIMELLDLTAFRDKEMEEASVDDLAERISVMRAEFVKNFFLTRDEDALLSSRRVAGFLKTDMALRMKKAMEAGLLYREQPFVLSLPANELNPEAPAEEKILVQGVIDVYFEEDGELVLLDYKTDSGADEEELWKRYRAQLRYYALALEKLEKKKVKEIAIYSFFLGKTFSLGE